MADIKTLPLDISYDDLREETAYPMVRAEPRPLTAGLVPAFAALFPKIEATAAAEWALVLTVMRLEAVVVYLDACLDETVDAIIGAILVITNNDRKHWLYEKYLDGQQPADFKAPILDEELTTLDTKWLPELKKSPFTTLSAFAPGLGTQIDEAKKAVVALAAAKQNLESFRSETGERGALVAEINAVRKGAHGQLGVIAHSNPLSMLPPTFGDGFFPTGRSGRKLTVKEWEARKAAAQRTLANIDERLAEARADEQRKADKKTRREETRRQRDLARAEKKAAELDAKIAELKGEPTKG